MLKQPQYSPMPMEEQVVSIYACTPPEGRDVLGARLELGDIARYEREMLDYMRTQPRRRARRRSATRGKLEDDVETKLAAALDEFAKTFQPAKRWHGQAA